MKDAISELPVFLGSIFFAIKIYHFHHFAFLREHAQLIQNRNRVIQVLFEECVSN